MEYKNEMFSKKQKNMLYVSNNLKAILMMVNGIITKNN